MENENKEVVKDITIKENYSISNFNELGNKSDTITEVYTNINDEKQIFNLENNVDCLLNDCEGVIIQVKDILIKTYIKPSKNSTVDENGEIKNEIERTMSCVLVDVNGKSYATGSKIFTIQLMRYLQMRSRIHSESDVFEIKITRKKVGEKGNKALSFELV